MGGGQNSSQFHSVLTGIVQEELQRLKMVRLKILFSPFEMLSWVSDTKASQKIYVKQTDGPLDVGHIK